MELGVRASRNDSMCFRHLAENKMGYVEHACHALAMAARMAVAAIKLTVHAAVPSFFETDATDTMVELVREHETVVGIKRQL